MTRRMSTSRRARIFTAAKGICHLCGSAIDGTREPWEAEHVIALEISGDDSDDNLRPAHVACHKAKTKDDAGRIAKAKRVAAKHVGAFRPRNPLPGGRQSKWRKRMDGTVERRD